jgi:hypothetical protein
MKRILIKCITSTTIENSIILFDENKSNHGKQRCYQKITNAVSVRHDGRSLSECQIRLMQ